MDFINAFLAILVILIYIYSGNSAHLPSWCIFGVILVAAFRTVSQKKHLDRSIFSVIIFSYMVLSLVGIISVWAYVSSYGFPFAPYNDDSYYFLNIKSLAGWKFPDEYTLYELFMVPAYWLFSFVNKTVSVQDLLPANWAMGAVVVGLAGRLSTKISGRFSLLAIAALLINYNFVDTVIHLYRDVFLLMLSLLCVMHAMRKKYLLALGFAFLAGLTRGGNGLLCIFYVIVFYLFHIGWLKKLNLKTMVVFAVMIVGFIIIDNIAALGGLGRSFMGATEDHEKQTMMGRAVQRQDTMLSGSSGGFDSTKLLHSLGPLGMAVIPLAATINPIRWSSFYATTSISVFRKNRGFGSVLRPVLFFMLLTVISWPFIGPPLILGFLRSIKSVEPMFILSIIFLVTVFVIALVSFQARHRTAFLIFFPCFVALTAGKTDTDKKFRTLLTVFFAVFIIAVNMLPHILRALS
ncbi:MAG: hypothetical protein JW943_11600 [Deltaproteobacteria bacterium]|nr:hypothetical protein [Deltaproteobacteria bacterium]